MRVLADAAIDWYGIDSPPIVQVLAPNVPQVVAHESVADAVFRADDGRIVHLEFQSTPEPDLYRFLGQTSALASSRFTVEAVLCHSCNIPGRRSQRVRPGRSRRRPRCRAGRAWPRWRWWWHSPRPFCLLRGIQEGIRAGLKAGREEGREEGQIRLREIQMAQRFGSVPDTVRSRLASLSATQVEAIALRLVTADPLDGGWRNWGRCSGLPRRRRGDPRPLGPSHPDGRWLLVPVAASPGCSGTDDPCRAGCPVMGPRVLCVTMSA